MFRIARLRLRLCFGTSRRNGGHFFASRALDAGGLSAQVAQVVEAGAADFALADHFNRANRRRVKWENAFNANAETHAAHSERGTRSAALLGDHHPFESLQALFFLLALAFLQADVDADRVARAKFREVFAQLRFM